MLLIGNGRVLTRDKEKLFLEDGAVAVEGELIKEVGSLSALKEKYRDAEFVDARGGLIMPGLINAHTHIYSGLARGLSIKGNNPTNFYEILDGTWWAIDRKLDLNGTKASAYATILDCIIACGWSRRQAYAGGEIGAIVVPVGHVLVFGIFEFGAGHGRIDEFCGAIQFEFVYFLGILGSRANGLVYHQFVFPVPLHAQRRVQPASIVGRTFHKSRYVVGRILDAGVGDCTA